MENSVKERLKEFILYKKISIREFERLCDLSNGYVKGIKHSILPNKMKSISLHFPDLNPIWLLTGNGEMLQGSEKKEEAKPSGASPMEILEELRKNYIEKEERLLRLIESQQEVIKNQSEALKKTVAQADDNVICAAASGSEIQK